jgi:hypothetical protein
MDRLNVRNILKRKNTKLKEITIIALFVLQVWRKPPFIFSSPVTSAFDAGIIWVLIGTLIWPSTK